MEKISQLEVIVPKSSTPPTRTQTVYLEKKHPQKMNKINLTQE